MTPSTSTAVTPSSASRPTDDEILGLTVSSTPPANPNSPGPDDLESAEAEQGVAPDRTTTSSEPPEFREILASNPKLREAWRDAQAFHEIFPTVEDARAAVAHSADLAKLDALFFSQDPESHAQLAQALRSLNPQAFANLAKAMNGVSATTANPASANTPVEQNSAAQPVSAALNDPNGQQANPSAIDQATSQPTFAHEHAFFHETNAVAVEGVLHSIQSQLDRLLPEGTPQNTRNRLTGEIYREVDKALQSNRAFGQQLREAFRSGQLTPENQTAIVAMVVGRAKQSLPGIAKKVLGEWTAGVVAHAQSRQERQRQAARRVDIAGGQPGSPGPRALMPKDIDYRRMSDNDILNL